MARMRPVRYQSSLEDSSRWGGFAFRDGDIVISAPSKSGTTWTQMLCALLVFQSPDLPAPLTTLSPWLDMRVRPAGEVHAHLARQTHRRFIKTHTPLDGLPDDDRVTYLAVGRDPRDVVISLHHQGTNLRRDVIRRLVGDAERADDGEVAAPELRDEHDFVRRWLSNDESPLVNLDSLRGVLWQHERAWSLRYQPNVVLVHYADLARDLERQMRRLANRLQIAVPESRWHELVAAAGFDQMRQRAVDLVPDERLGIMRDTRSFFRAGTSGSWRRVFNDDDLAAYGERVAELAKPDLAHWVHHGGA